MDKVGFAVVTRPKHNRSRRGEPAFFTVLVVRSRNISVLEAMIYNVIFEGAVNGENCKQCLKEIKEYCIIKGIENLI